MLHQPGIQLSDSEQCTIVEGASAAPTELLSSALMKAGFWTALQDAQERIGIPRNEMHVLVKPDLVAFDVGSPTATEPALAESLIDQLHDEGYTRVDVCSTTDSSYFWAENRDVPVLADLLGYGYITPRGRSYDVLDLGEDLSPASFPAGGVLHGSVLSRVWQDAAFRICFARNKTDEREAFALCLNGLLAVLPQADKEYYYRQRVSAGEAVSELLALVPVDFAIVDATTSAHGSGGSRAPLAINTATILASRDVGLVDFIGALKMGLDPYASSLAATVFRRGFLPKCYTVNGNLGSYPNWQNVQPVITESYLHRDRLPPASRLLTPWLQTLNSELFPLKQVVDAKVNASLSSFFTDLDDRPLAMSLLTLTNYAVGGVAQGLDAYKILYAKDSIRQVEVPLGFEPEAYQLPDFLAIRSELDQLEPLLSDIAEAAEGLRWREVDGATLFEYQRDLPILFEEFVEHVEVSLTIQYMNDYLGGVVVPLEFDEAKRVVRQAERNLYLPQPNYLALSGGQNIDVSKIEICDYSNDLHRMYWKTIKSENASAVYDDGVVMFRRTPRGTNVRIMGRQLFTLPPLWQALNLDLAPKVKAGLVTDAYKTFFDRTCANFEALVEGRDVRLGRAWHEPASSYDTEPLPSQEIERVALRLGQSLQSLLEKPSVQEQGAADSAGSLSSHIDEDGFRHFYAASSPPSEAAGATPLLNAALLEAVNSLGAFLVGLNQAFARDVSPSTSHPGSTPD